MKYISVKDNFLCQPLSDFFWEELNKNGYMTITDEKNSTETYMYEESGIAKLNGKAFLIHQVANYTKNNNRIVLTINETSSQKIIEYKSFDKALIDALEENLHIIELSKTNALHRYNLLKREIDESYDKYTLLFRIDSEEIYYLCHGELDGTDEENIAKAVEIYTTNGEYFFAYKNEKHKIDEMYSRKLKDINFNTAYCYGIRFQPIYEDYIINIEIDFLIKRS